MTKKFSKYNTGYDRLNDNYECIRCGCNFSLTIKGRRQLKYVRSYLVCPWCGNVTDKKKVKK